MLIRSVTLKNFRGYRNETTVLFSNLTTFVGRNDIGKSTILEALDIFFNEGKGCISLDKEDINKRASNEGDDEVIIAVEFFKLPDSLVIDESNRTTLAAEYLLTESNTLKIVKRYPKAGKEKVYIRAKHPTNAVCCDLLNKKINDLKTILSRENIECEDQTRKAVIRAAIWNHFADNLNLEEKEIDVTKEDGKTIWESLKKFLPVYSLFQADRSNNDHDKDMNPAVSGYDAASQVSKVSQTIDNIIEQKMQDIEDKTEARLDKLSNTKILEMNEYADGVLKEINRNHNEVMFMYDMLNEKDKEIKTTVKDVNGTRMNRNTNAYSEKKSQNKQSAQNKPSVKNDIAEVVLDDALSSNEKIIKLYNSGYRDVDIAKRLKMGVGEVRLIINLSSGNN